MKSNCMSVDLVNIWIKYMSLFVSAELNIGNFLIKQITIKIIKRIGYKTSTSEMRTIAYFLSLINMVNAIFIVLLLNASFLTPGGYSDFSSGWY